MTMKNSTDLRAVHRVYERLVKDAYRLLRKKKYSDAAIILAGIADELSDTYPWFLLGVANFYTGDFTSAESALNLAERLNPSYLPAAELRAFAFLKSADSRDAALSHYIQHQARFPDGEKFARMTRALMETSDFTRFQKNVQLTDFVTLAPPGKEFTKKIRSLTLKRPVTPVFASNRYRRPRLTRGTIMPLSLLIFALIMAGTAFFFRATLSKTITGLFMKPESAAQLPSDEIDMVSLAGNDYDLLSAINRKETPYFYHSVEAMKDDFDRARLLIKKGEYNEALRLLNRIDLSNASRMVREKVAFLVTYISKVEERRFDAIPWADIVKEPLLYRGFSMSIRGRAANLSSRGQGTAFKLMVNSITPDRFDGIIDVYSREKYSWLKDGSAVKLKGLFMVIGNRNSPYVEAIVIEDERSGSRE